MTGKSISIFLLDGTPEGIIICELFNFTGKGYKIPKSSLNEVKARQDLKKAGVYFLIGKDDADSDVVYIGEAEEVYKRLLQHQNKEFWTEALTFTSKDDNLNKAHIKFLEYSLYSDAKKAARYKLENNNIPSCPNISESDKAVMTEFAENLRLLTGTMGYKIFHDLTEKKVSKQDIYYISAARGVNASAVITSEGIVVLKGSEIATSEVSSTPPAIKNKRVTLINNGIIKDFKFVEDYLFSSPSTAAAVVMGRNANGLIEWKKKDNSTMKDNQPKEE